MSSTSRESVASRTRLLVFAHTPPPFHGQSYMVQLMLQEFGGDCRKARGTSPANRHGIDCYHVNVRLSRDLADIGVLQPMKLLRLLLHCLEAIWCRFRYGVKTMYYVPAPGKRPALYRDLLVMLLCRPFFPRLILHWHAAGLGGWLETDNQMRWRILTYKAIGCADLSIALSDFNRRGVAKFLPRNIRVVYNGIPDPCPEYDTALAPRREARCLARAKLAAGQTLTDAERAAAGGDPEVFRVLFLALCSREKGLFDTLEGFLLAREQLLRSGSALRLELCVAGSFHSGQDRAAFEQCLPLPGVQYAGFVTGGRKQAELSTADLLCFPTYYAGENHPVNLIEAFAYGLPVITTRWRSLPEFLPDHYAGLVDPQDPGAVAAAIVLLTTRNDCAELRRLFLQRYTLERHAQALAAAIRSTDPAGTVPAEQSSLGNLPRLSKPAC